MTLQYKLGSLHYIQYIRKNTALHTPIKYIQTFLTCIISTTCMHTLHTYMYAWHSHIACTTLLAFITFTTYTHPNFFINTARYKHTAVESCWPANLFQLFSAALISRPPGGPHAKALLVPTTNWLPFWSTVMQLQQFLSSAQRRQCSASVQCVQSLIIPPAPRRSCASMALRGISRQQGSDPSRNANIGLLCSPWPGAREGKAQQERKLGKTLKVHVDHGKPCSSATKWPLGHL